MGRPSNTARKDGARTGDARLIRACVTYAQSVAAVRAGHEVDPNSDGAHAEALAQRHYERAARALIRITQTQALTLEGLQAKARLVPVLMAAAYGALSPEEEAFIISFAAEVRGYLAEAMVVAGEPEVAPRA